jgi:hypothetical protein
VIGRDMLALNVGTHVRPRNQAFTPEYKPPD